jgi:hypothetical protein
MGTKQITIFFGTNVTSFFGTNCQFRTLRVVHYHDMVSGEGVFWYDKERTKKCRKPPHFLLSGYWPENIKSYREQVIVN